MKFCPVCGTEYADEIRFCQRDGQTLRASNPGGDLVGQVIADRYHISKKLGEGGMGAVYLAEHVKMGRQSAIKVMGSGMSHDPEAISRFNREAANASRINHPNVCAVYDFGETEDGTIYLAMEFVEGRTLSSLLKETGPLPLPRAVGLLKQCADGLQAAHDLGIVHRDLKPDNIMIVSPKGREVIKVVDFGIAKAGTAEPGQNVTKTGLVVGTPEYMSPEQLSGDKVDGRSDIYSLALVFYRTITDTLPFIADTAQETMIKRLTDEPIPLAQARPDAALSFPPALQKVMDKALARWPLDRYASATEFAAEAAHAIEGVKSITASVDTEARTQVVKPADIASAKTAAIPATRVSSQKAPSRVSPVMVGVGVVVLALAGGGYVMRGALFGANETPGTDSSQGRNPADSNVQPLSQQAAESTVTSDTANPIIQPNGTQNPPRNPGNQTRGNRGDTTSAPVDPPPRPSLAEIENQVAEFVRDPEFVNNPQRRVAGETLGRSVWSNENLPTRVRADGAFLVFSSLEKDASNRRDDGIRRQAKDWLQRAVDLNPKPVWQQILQGL